MTTGASGAVRVAIAEKNPLLQQGLAKLFEGHDRLALVAVVADGQELLRLAEDGAFDVGVIGWEMPNLDGPGVLRALRARAGAPRIVVYTGTPDANVPRQAMALGAAGFASKSDAPEQLLETIATVAAGRMVFPFIDVTTLWRDPMAELTRRECELLAALATGQTNQEIARQARISLNTVKFHLKHLYDKLGVANRAQAVALYLRNR